MAEVFFATQTGDGGFEKSVAVKRILPHLLEDAETVAMFRDEALLASRLSHPNIAQTFDLVEAEDTLLIAMEWIEGKDLRRVLGRAGDQGPRLTPVRALVIAEKVAAALAHAHAARGSDGEPLLLVHRDVSPHNVMLTYEGEVKLTDFGIAKATQRSVNTATGMIKGKVAYMSPEQARGEALDARTDVFALGVILWEMLCGRRLFKADSDLAILRAVQEQDSPAPSSFQGDLPEALDTLVLSALERDLEARLPSAEAFQRRAAELLLELTRSPTELSLGPWMRALYPAESQGGGAGTARMPASASPCLTERASAKTESESGPSPTRPDLPGDREGRGAGLAATAALASLDGLELGASPRPRPSRRMIGWSLGVGLTAIIVFNLFTLGVFDRFRTAAPPAGESQTASTPPATPAPTIPTPEAVAPIETTAGAIDETSEAAAGTDESADAPSPRNTRTKRTRTPKEHRAAPSLARAAPPPTEPEVREAAATSGEESAAPEETPPPPAPAVTPTPDTSAVRGGTTVLTRREAPTAAPLRLAAGTILEVRLLDPARAGSATRLELQRSVIKGEQVLLARGTRFRTEPQARDRRLHLSIRTATTPAGKNLTLSARAVDPKGGAGIPASDPTSPEAPLMLAPGTRLRLELLETLVIAP